MENIKYSESYKKNIAKITFDEDMSYLKIHEKYKIHPSIARNWRLKYFKNEISNDTTKDIFINIEEDICMLLGDKIQTWCENESVYAPDNIQTIYLSFTEINNNALLELSFYLYGGTRKNAEQGVYYWEYDRNFNNKKFEDEFNKKFRKDLKNIILKNGYLIKVVLFEAEEN